MGRIYGENIVFENIHILFIGKGHSGTGDKHYPLIGVAACEDVQHRAQHFGERFGQNTAPCIQKYVYSAAFEYRRNNARVRFGVTGED